MWMDLSGKWINGTLLKDSDNSDITKITIGDCEKGDDDKVGVSRQRIKSKRCCYYGMNVEGKYYDNTRN